MSVNVVASGGLVQVHREDLGDGVTVHHASRTMPLATLLDAEQLYSDGVFLQAGSASAAHQDDQGTRRLGMVLTAEPTHRSVRRALDTLAPADAHHVLRQTAAQLAAHHDVTTLPIVAELATDGPALVAARRQLPSAGAILDAVEAHLPFNNRGAFAERCLGATANLITPQQLAACAATPPEHLDLISVDAARRVFIDLSDLTVAELPRRTDITVADITVTRHRTAGQLTGHVASLPINPHTSITRWALPRDLTVPTDPADGWTYIAADLVADNKPSATINYCCRPPETMLAGRTRGYRLDAPITLTDRLDADGDRGLKAGLPLGALAHARHRQLHNDRYDYDLVERAGYAARERLAERAVGLAGRDLQPITAGQPVLARLMRTDFALADDAPELTYEQTEQLMVMLAPAGSSGGLAHPRLPANGARLRIAVPNVAVTCPHSPFAD